VNLQGTSLSYFVDPLLLIGYPSGEIDVWEMIDGKLVRSNGSSCLQAYSGPIRAMSFGKSIWVSCSSDGSVAVWDYHLLLSLRIRLPEPLFACEILNTRRDLIVATDSEIMTILGSLLFGEEVDGVIPSLDRDGTLELKAPGGQTGHVSSVRSDPFEAVFSVVTFRKPTLAMTSKQQRLKELMRQRKPFGV
jgi:WD40 repeat protein